MLESCFTHSAGIEAAASATRGGEATRVVRILVFQSFIAFALHSQLSVLRTPGRLEAGGFGQAL
jgi:hypothetical protein